jgi:hypothetical protein
MRGRRPLPHRLDAQEVSAATQPTVTPVREGQVSPPAPPRSARLRYFS